MSEDPDNVVYPSFVTRLDIPVERVIKNCPDLTDVVILGYTQEGSEYFASSYAGGHDVLWLLERMKKRLLEVGDG